MIVTINGALVKDTTFSPGPSNELVINLTHSTKADTTQYIYKLADLDSAWTTYRQAINAKYYQLPGGTYHLLVYTKNNLLKVKHIQIEIEPLLWQRWWFLPFIYFAAFVILGTAIYFSYLYRLHQQVRMLSVRENIARDLHDDMGSYLGSISMLSQTVLNVAQKDPQHARLLVDKIGETARQVMESMSDIVWAINPENDSMAQIIVRMRDVATDLLGTQDITLHQDIDEAVKQAHLPLEHRRDFFLIYKEALTNIAKYASASQVWVRLQRHGQTLILTIQDDGAGFNTRQIVGRNLLGGNGIKNMHARAEKLGGTLTIQSVPGLGSTLTLQILLE
ncbi:MULTISPECIES: histidine kinase [unclassified Spirosoma]|uniref:ATP-binding protein n=1 Tax=unclassified Spirosoma TaxID=2621999 RepID=UPI000962AC23|nr:MULTISPECIES: histidine kinase [unclassified Spirosoma]MBN8820494.1 sensor histidine kinase [Spirosoma sp.]OJW71281.1 MAG: hypothetical protein BGO59_03455 [Spirosoma sp. 48-14]